MTGKDDQRTAIINSNGHVLVLGGPGSGKTHIALLKADRYIRAGTLLPGQSVLFLSFARATVARLAEKAADLVGPIERRQLELNTYHGFAWNILRSHGYLLQPKPHLKLLPPPEAASHLSTIPKARRDAEKERLFMEDGVLHFDLFARKTEQLLSNSKRLRKILCSAYPIIILDEFQDTNTDEWGMIQAFGAHSHLVALADADQRIYEFRGADPKRIGEFITMFSPSQFDFGTENHRSNGTDITQFGNDLLAGTNQGRSYKDVNVDRYGFYRGMKPAFALKSALYDAIRRCIKRGTGNWSIAVLVPSKNLMLSVSAYLESEQDGLPAITHDVALDKAGPALAASVIAFVLEPHANRDQATTDLLRRLCHHIYGRKGDAPATADERKLVEALREFCATGKVRGSRRKALVADVEQLVADRAILKLNGDPGTDWLAVRHLFSNAKTSELQEIAHDAKYLRLLHKGAVLRKQMAEFWRKYKSYVGVEEAVKNALLQEHFSSTMRPVQGISVTTIHKSKGKEFSEVVIYEDPFQGRYVRVNATASEVAQARLTLRVGVTRAMFRTLILTPRNDSCPLL